MFHNLCYDAQFFILVFICHAISILYSILNVVSSIIELQKNIVVQKQVETDVLIWEVNFSDTLLRMIRDTQTIANVEKRDGLQDSLPEEAKFLMSNYEKLMSSKVKIQVLLE